MQSKPPQLINRTRLRFRPPPDDPSQIQEWWREVSDELERRIGQAQSGSNTDLSASLALLQAKVDAIEPGSGSVDLSGINARLDILEDQVNSLSTGSQGGGQLIDAEIHASLSEDGSFEGQWARICTISAGTQIAFYDLNIEVTPIINYRYDVGFWGQWALAIAPAYHQVTPVKYIPFEALGASVLAIDVEVRIIDGYIEARAKLFGSWINSTSLVRVQVLGRLMPNIQ